MFSTIPRDRIRVSKTGTRHICAGGDRVLCHFTIRSGEALPQPEATCDCRFCLGELADMEERENVVETADAAFYVYDLEHTRKPAARSMRKEEIYV